MIFQMRQEDRKFILQILQSNQNFNETEVDAGMEVVDDYLEGDNDYKIFIDEDNYSSNPPRGPNGFIAFAKRPLTEGTWDIYWIAVNSQLHSQGVGTRLIQYAEEYIKTWDKQANLIILETSGREGYNKERKFYEKNGYTNLVEIKDFYKQNDSLCIFGKYI